MHNLCTLFLLYNMFVFTLKGWPSKTFHAMSSRPRIFFSARGVGRENIFRKKSFDSDAPPGKKLWPVSYADFFLSSMEYSWWCNCCPVFRLAISVWNTYFDWSTVWDLLCYYMHQMLPQVRISSFQFCLSNEICEYKTKKTHTLWKHPM